MSSKIFTDEERRQFAIRLSEEIRRRGLKITAAAKVLGVTRQSLHNHLRPDGKHQPRLSVIRRAVRAWDLVVYAQGKRFDRNAFGFDIIPQDPAVQLLLTEAIDRIQNTNLEVTILRKDPSSLALEVLVKFAG